MTVDPFKNLARTLDSGRSSQGSVEWLHLAVDSSTQLESILSEAGKRNAYVIRGNPRRYQEKLYNYLASLRKDTPGATALFLDISALKQVTEHVRQDQVISVEAGITIAELDDILSNHGQWLPVSFYEKNLMIADLIDSGDSGSTETMTGGMRALTLGITVALSGGKSIKTGGKIVKNVTGYDLGKMFVGARGWFGIPHMVHLRLSARPTKFETFVVSSPDESELFHLANTLSSTGLPLSCLEIVDSRLLCVARDQFKELPSGSGSASAIECLSSVCEFAKSSTASASDYAPLLVVSTQAHGSSAKETCEGLKQQVEPLKLPVLDLEETGGAQLAALLSDLPELIKAPSFEIAIAPSLMAYLMSTWWPENGRPMWTARPAAGRLKLALPADKTPEHSMDWSVSLRKFANLLGNSSWQSITLAYPTEQFDCLVEEISPSTDNPGRAEMLTQNLKMRFDPQGIFNPLASFRQARSEAVVPL